MPTFEVIPRYTFSSGTGVVARETLARSTDIAKMQLPVCAANQPLRFGYGTVRVGGMILKPVTYGSGLLLPFIAMRGPIDAVEAIQFEASDAPATISNHVYLGGTDNVIDSWLAAAWTAKGITYADTLPGIANGVLLLPRGTEIITGLALRCRALKVYDPRDGAQTLGSPTTYKWSADPVLALSDFIASTAYGRGETLDWESVADCADISDELPGGGSARRRFGIVFDTAQEVGVIEDTLRAYAGVWVVREGGTVRLVPDAPAASTFAFVPANYVSGSVRLLPRGRKDTPTVVTIKWTDISVTPWREAQTTYPPTGPGTGVQWREEVIAMPGIQDSGYATREAIRRLNEYALCDLTASLTAASDAIGVRIGDVVTLTDAGGLSAKPFRVMGHAAAASGCYAETLVEYDAACYSDALGDDPSNPDTTLPLPNDPPALTGLTATEETYQNDTGIFATRARIAWTDPAWPFVRETRVVLKSGATEIHSGTAKGSAVEYVTPALAEGTYTVEAQIVSTVGAEGAAVSTLVTLAGKAIAPGDVPTLSGFEVGGRVFLSWEPADNPTDPGTPDPDVWGYEIRRGTTAQAWDTATLVDRRDALRCVDEGAPAGTWRYHVKAIDSVGQYSATAATRDITVTTDSAAFLVDSYDQTAPTLTNMASYTLGPTDSHTYYVTEDGIALGTKMAGALSAYTGILATHHASVTSTWLGESEDFGSLLGGQWTGSADVAALSGSIASYLGHSTDGSSWTYPAGLSQKVNARFARMKHEATTTSTLQVTVPTQNIRLDAIPRDETGEGTSSASAAVTVTLANDYVAVKKLTVTALGSTARFAVADNIVTGDPTTFDVYVFNDSGTKIESSFRYEFQGV